MRNEFRMLWSALVLLLLANSTSFAEEVKRRKDQYGRDNR